jgi:hypothetical protein
MKGKMKDRDKSVVYGVVCVLYALFVILLTYLIGGIKIATLLVIVLHLPVLAVGLVGLILKKYWKVERVILILTILAVIVVFFVLPYMDIVLPYTEI